jgi:hypothetical protein
MGLEMNWKRFFTCHLRWINQTLSSMHARETAVKEDPESVAYYLYALLHKPEKINTDQF